MRGVTAGHIEPGGTVQQIGTGDRDVRSVSWHRWLQLGGFGSLVRVRVALSRRVSRKEVVSNFGQWLVVINPDKVNFMIRLLM